MKRCFGSLAAIALLGVWALGSGALVRAQQTGPDAHQPMEIPEQYPQQYPGPYPPQQGGPQQYPQQQPQQQGDPQQQGQVDPGAARVSYMSGDLSTQHGDTGEWAAATLNTPIVNGDRVSTGNRSRAEIQLDYANVIRLSDESTFNVVNLSRSQIQLQIGQGLVNYDVIRGSEADVEIQTPNVAIHPQMSEGSFRILVNSDGETIIDVRKGSAEISTPQGSTHVERDQRITIQGNADTAQYQISGAPGRDDWDKWNSDRDHIIETAVSWQHTNPYYTGSQDLDPYGHWSDVPDYGSVWFPNSGPDFAPYRDGRWVFEPYYGWTWISSEPWGWAPYHYGRWFVYGGNWGWWPGPVYGGYRPVWAPAYVSFLGFGGRGWGVDVGVGFGSGFGSVGWLPIGPGDRFYPWYGRGVNRVNVVNVYDVHNERGGFGPLRGGPRAYSNVDRAFTDDHVRGGISSMRGDQFGRGRVPAQQQRFDASSLRQASFMTGRNPVSPSRESFRPSDRQVSSSAIPNRSVANQRFFGGSRPSTAGQNGFNRGGNFGNGQVQQNNGRPGFQGFGSNSRNAPSANPSRGSIPDQSLREAQGNPQGQRGDFGSPSQQQNSATQPGRPGWRTFSGGPSQSQQPRTGSRNYGAPSGPQPRSGVSNPQERTGYSQPPAESQRQNQNSSRGNPGGNYGRPPLVMQQPVVTPRARTYPEPQQRSAPRGEPSGGGYRGGQPAGGNRGGGNSGGGNNGGHSSSGHNRR